MHAIFKSGERSGGFVDEEGIATFGLREDRDSKSQCRRD